jgi:hypothetical protein
MITTNLCVKYKQASKKILQFTTSCFSYGAVVINSESLNINDNLVWGEFLYDSMFHFTLIINAHIAAILLAIFLILLFYKHVLIVHVNWFYVMLQYMHTRYIDQRCFFSRESCDSHTGTPIRLSSSLAMYFFQSIQKNNSDFPLCVIKTISYNFRTLMHYNTETAWIRKY